jgi:hypothetical protein
MKQYLKIKNFKLSQHTWQKRVFNANSSEDLKELEYFLKNGTWRKNCPFTLEWPHLTIQSVMNEKIIDCYLKKLIKNAKE